MTDAETQGRAGADGLTLLSLAVSMLLASLGVSIVTVALPTLAKAFLVPFPAVQWVVLAYLLAVTVMIVGAGRLGDMMGHRRVLFAGLSLFTLASAFCALAPNLWSLIVARALQGLGAATMMALTIALVRETVPREKTGSVMGLLGTVSAIGTAMGPSLGGLLLAGPGWRAIFLIMVPVGLVNMVLVLKALPLDRQPARSGLGDFDGPGMVLLGLTLAAYTLAVTARGGQSGLLNIGLLLLAALGTALFLRVERKSVSPLIDLAAFRNRALNASLAVNILVASVMMTTLVVGPFYLTLSLGVEAAAVGVVLSVGPVISALTGLPAGRLVDRLGTSRVMGAGLVAMACGSFALALLPALSGVVGYVAAIAILTPGYQLFQAANTTRVMVDVAPDRRGVVSGLLSLSRNLGLVTGASVMAALFSAASGAADPASATPGDLATGMQVTFVVAGVLMVVALALIQFGRIPPPGRSGASG